MSRGVLWTERELDYLQRAIETKRYSATFIGRVLGRTRNSVMGKAWKLDLRWNCTLEEVSRYNSRNARRGRVQNTNFQNMKRIVC